MTDGSDMSDARGTDGLARTISGVGLTISQAADELQQAAERLIAAEERAREADARAAAMEDQLAQGATSNAELLALMQAAREDHSEAEERARQAEERSNVAMERGRLLEDRAHELEEQIAELQARLEEEEAPKPGVTVILDDERTALQEAIAAEIRRPLTSILGITLALKHTDSKSPDGKEMVRQLSTSARRLDRLVGEMLDVDRIAAGTYAPNLRRTDLKALVRRVIEESPELANRNVKVEADHVAIEVDPALVEHIVETLLANSGRRTVPGNEVWVRVTPHEGGAVIAVDDLGAEVPSGLRQAMFSPVQGGAGAGQQRPRGATGLSLLARLADIHGGRCWVEERPGGGASFRVFLPESPPSHGAASTETQEGQVATPVADDETEEAPGDVTASASPREAGIGRDPFAI